MSEWKEYELGVADVIRHHVGSAAIVEHDAHIDGRTGRDRQVDIAVRGPIFGLDDGLLVVDCKHHARPVSVAIVDAFLGLVDDVSADLGMLVTTAGLTKTAQARAKAGRLRVRVLSRTDLDRWSPPGTRSVTVIVPSTQGDAARAAFVDAGFRVRVGPDAAPSGHVSVQAFRLADIADGTEFQERAMKALGDANIDVHTTATGVSIGGGTPAHRWIPIYPAGSAEPLRVLAATEAELQAEVAKLAELLRVPISELRADPPEGWPFADTFGPGGS
jgi:Restriction endonuclease